MAFSVQSHYTWPTEFDIVPALNGGTDVQGCNVVVGHRLNLPSELQQDSLIVSKGSCRSVILFLLLMLVQGLCWLDIDFPLAREVSNGAVHVINAGSIPYTVLDRHNA